MFWIKNLETRIESTQDAIDLMNNQAKQSIKYPCRNKDWTIDYIPLWELTEEYKRNQIRYHSNRINESQYLLSLLK